MTKEELRKKRFRRNIKTGLGKGFKHGGSTKPEYRSWQAMKARCNNPNHDEYKNYGLRGITICERWLDFKNFIHDMGNKPTKAHTLERKDSNGNYEPGNCRWATPLEQSNNKRNNLSITYKGKTQSLSAWCRELSLSYKTISNRYNTGFSIEMMFEKPIKKRYAVQNTNR